MTTPFFKPHPDAGLPRIFKGDYVDVTMLSMSQRRTYGLSTFSSITQVTTDAGLVEAVAYARAKGSTTIDTETAPEVGGDIDDALDPWLGRIILVQLGDRERQFVIWAERITDWSPLLDLLADPAIVVKGQNLKFDIKFMLVKHGLDKRWWNVADAGIVEQIIGCGLFSEDDDSVGFTLKATSMEHMARRWLGLQLNKDEELRTGWGNFTPETLPIEKLLYAADDVCIPEMILEKQRGWVKRLGLAQTINLEHAFLPVLADMECRGILMDMVKWEVLAEENETKTRDAIRALDRLFDVTVTVDIDEAGHATYTRDKNYGSKDQLKDLLRSYCKDHHGIDLICCNKHMKESLLENGFTPERAEKLFMQSKVPNPKKPGKNKIIGAPYMVDTAIALWEDYSDYLGPTAFLMENTKSQTLKLNKIIHATEKQKLASCLPNKIGVPALLVDPLTTLRKASKAAGTYGKTWKRLINSTTGRVHFNFIQAALTTGRLSSTPNAQNLPGGGTPPPGFLTGAPYRECFIAAGDAHPVEPSTCIGSDWDQIEPRIIAQLSNCFAYKRVFFSKHPERPEFTVYCNGVTEALDLYTEIGKMVGVIPEWMTVKETKGGNGVEPLKEGKKGRKQSKIIVLGLGYGTGKDKFFITLILDLDEAQDRNFSDELYDKFWFAVPEVKETLDKFSSLTYPGEDVVRGGRVTRKKSPRRVWHPFLEMEVTWSETIGGRKRFYRPTSFSWWTTGRNHPVQGTGADILKRAMVLFARWCWENLDPAFGLINSVHDELLAEVPKARAPECLKVMEKFMTEVGESYIPDVPITAAGYIAPYWLKD